MHSGERAGSRCAAAVFTRDGTWSWSHLATKCSYGLPTHATYVRGLSFVFVVVVTVTLLSVVVALLREERVHAVADP